MALRQVLQQCTRGIAGRHGQASLQALLPNACRASEDATTCSREARRDYGTVPGTAAPSPFSSFSSRPMSSYGSAAIPDIADVHISKALNTLLAAQWQHISPEVAKEVQSAISKGGQGSELLQDAWRAADAVAKYADKLEQMRMELDDQSTDGNATRDSFAAALEAVKGKYDKYLASFDFDENWLKKKVEMELGTPIMHLKQRVSGLGAEWSKISLLSTTGIWGSYIERRSDANPSASSS